MGFVLRYLTELRKKMCGLKQERGICVVFTLCVLFMMMVTGDQVFTPCVYVCVYDQVFTLCVYDQMFTLCMTRCSHCVYDDDDHRRPGGTLHRAELPEAGDRRGLSPS